MPLVSNRFSNSGPGAPEPAREYGADDVETVEHDADEQPDDEEPS
jgi:hypothetical protein